MILRMTPPVDGYTDGHSTDLWVTDDLVERAADGSVRILGRSFGRLRVNGRTVDRIRVEEALLQGPGVTEVFLLSRPRPLSREVEDLIACVAGSECHKTEVTRYCLKHLPPSCRPAAVVVFPKLPRNELGKIDHSLVRVEVDRRLGSC